MKPRPASKPASIEEYLRTKKHDPSWRGGRRCQTCEHAKSADINRELRVFAKAKSDGHEMPWSRFYRDRLREVYGIRLSNAALTRHVQECLELL